VEKSEHQQIISAVLKEMTGADLRIKCVNKEGLARKAAAEKKPTEKQSSIDMLIDELGAEEIT
jgi:hypothetical protein